MSLTKADMAQQVHQELGMTKKDAVQMVELLFSILKDTLAKGDNIKIAGFGHFTLKEKRSRMGRNPQTGESMRIDARCVLTFRPSNALKEDITKRYGRRLDDQGRENYSIAPGPLQNSKALRNFCHEVV